MRSIIIRSSLLCILLLTVACSRKNDTFLSRNYHAVNAEYNTLYNGINAFEEGRDALIADYRDNFFEILPIEPLEQFDEVVLPGESKNPSFERAEEKAIKAIQKHGMEIDGKERNPQIDEAFMLLGKARYYDQRFVRALESFNYILAYYPASNNIAQAKIWKAKTNIRLNNDVVAIENLHKLLDQEEKLKDQDYADAAAMLAQGYLNIERRDSALVYIDKAATGTQKNDQKGRYLYIQGQLYDAIGEHVLANETYDRIIDLNRKAPRRYMINAYIAKARNFDYDNEDRLAFQKVLEELEQDRENRPFLDGIYNQLGEYYRNIDSTDLAVTYYNKSLKTPGVPRQLVYRNFLTLGDINFDRAEFQRAGAYYDSTLTNLPERSRQYRDINKKRENLNDVIRYEQVAQQNDSILSLVNMSESERKTYFEAYVASLREKARKDSIATSLGLIVNNVFFNPAANGNTGGPRTEDFYFYNPTQVAQGSIAFRNRWGKRELADNWRVSAQRVGLPGSVERIVQDGETLGEDPRYDLDQYIDAIPTRAGQIDSLARDRDFANYQLGLIYKEKFKEYGLAADRLEKLLSQKPEQRLILPAKYYLYQIYVENNAQAKQDEYKADILNNYADSRYASFIKNPNTALAKDADTPEALYNTLYRKFEAQDYATVITEADRYIDLFAGDVFVPKFELLKATAIGRLDGFQEYTKALNYVALNYPNQEEGKKAQQLLNEVMPQLQDSGFKEPSPDSKWKLVYALPSGSAIDFEKEKAILAKALADYNLTQYYMSADPYTRTQEFLVVHGFSSQESASAFAERLNTDKAHPFKIPATAMTSENYRVVQIHKNLSSYLTQNSN